MSIATKRMTMRKKRTQRPWDVHHVYVLFLLLLLVRASVAESATTDENKICFLLYQNADCDMSQVERSLRDNLKEWIGSPALNSGQIVSWVYHDALNLPATQEEAVVEGVISTPLEGVWTADGSQLLTSIDGQTKYEGALYLRFDVDSRKMVVDQQLGEKNSDDPGVLYEFVRHAVTDCVSKGATDLMLVMNGYGAGSAGFGGDGTY
jgi:hypothetical protein